MEGPNRPISEVHPHLRRCTEKIAQFSDSIRELLDTVVVASQGVDKGDILTAWNNGTDYLDLPCQAVRVSAEVALDFTDDPTYVQLPKRESKRGIGTTSFEQIIDFRFYLNNFSYIPSSLA